MNKSRLSNNFQRNEESFDYDNLNQEFITLKHEMKQLGKLLKSTNSIFVEIIKNNEILSYNKKISNSNENNFTNFDDIGKSKLDIQNIKNDSFEQENLDLNSMEINLIDKSSQDKEQDINKKNSKIENYDLKIDNNYANDNISIICEDENKSSMINSNSSQIIDSSYNNNLKLDSPSEKKNSSKILLEQPRRSSINRYVTSDNEISQRKITKDSKKSSMNQSSININNDSSSHGLLHHTASRKSLKKSSTIIKMKLDLDENYIKKQNQKNQKVSEQLLQDKIQLLETPFSTIISSNNHVSQLNELKEFIIKTEDLEDETEESILIEDLLFFDKNFFKHEFNLLIKPFFQINTAGDRIPTLILQLECCDILENNFIIDPRNIQYLMQSLFVFLLIIIIVIQIPYYMAFEDESLYEFNYYFDVFVTIVFIIDIVLNFFIAYEIAQDQYEYNLSRIIYQQLIGSFLLDFVATIPIDQIIQSIDFNTSLIKGIRILKIFKLIRIIKFSKLFSIQNTNLKAFIGDEIILLVKKSSGFIDLMRQNLQILIASHQYTILFQQVKSQLINKDHEDKSWIKIQQAIDQDNMSNFKIYVELLSENVKTALGLGSGAKNMTDLAELGIQMAWIFIGLSMFGYGIGNISSYLNYMNHSEIEYNDTKNQFLEICENQNVDRRIATLINRDIHNYFQSQDELNLQKKGYFLSAEVLNQLESFIYKGFISSFELMEKLKITLIRYMKSHATFHKGSFTITKGAPVTDLIFITKGKLTLFDERMRIQDILLPNEIFGFQELINQWTVKQDQDLDSLLSKIDLTGDEEKRTESFAIVREQVRKRMKEKSENNNQIMFSSNLSTFLNVIEDEQYYSSNNDYPIHSDDLEYFSVPFSALEGIIFNDFDSFLAIQLYYYEQNEPISEYIRIESFMTFQRFNDNKFCGMIVTQKGDIQDINQQFIDLETVWVKNLIGVNLLDVIVNDNLGNKVSSIEDLKFDDQLIESDMLKRWFSIKEIDKKIITSVNGIDNCNETEKEEDLFIKKKLKYSEMKKSLLTVYILQFTMQNI